MVETTHRRLPGPTGDNGYSWLFVALFGVLFGYALIELGSWVGALLRVVFVAQVVVALWVCLRRRFVFFAGLAFIVAQQICDVAAEVGGSEKLKLAGIVLRFCFLVMVTASIVADVARASRITRNVVAGACVIYLMLALTFGALYETIEQAMPGSFKLGQVDSAVWLDRFDRLPTAASLTYFSMITMTTVGYGDVTPLSNMARTLAAIQGLVGQLFIAVVLARFVALELAERAEHRRSSTDD